MSDAQTALHYAVRDDIRALAAYQVPDSSGMVKLDAMENPYQLPQDLRLALGQRLAQVTVNRYPEGGSGKRLTVDGHPLTVPLE